MKQNDAPVALPNQVLVGTSTYGERTPPTTLPCTSTTGVLGVASSIIRPGGGGVPLRTQLSRFCSMASNRTPVGKRLRVPSLHANGGTGRPALTMSSDRAE